MSYGIEDQTYELVDVATLSEHPENPREGDVEAIVTSIVRNGWHGALTVQRSTRWVVVGNHRLRAARQLGMSKVPVLWADLDEDEARRKLVGDNRASEFGHWNEDALVDLLRVQSPEDLAGMLFSEADVALLVPAEPAPHDDDRGPDASIAPQGQEAREDYLATQARSIVLPYPLDVYVKVTDNLRRMRDAYGLSTNAEVVARLAEEAAALVAAEA